MAELLLELFSEEIPARMQLRAAEDLRRLVVDKLAAVQVAHESAQAFVTARRLTLVVAGLVVLTNLVVDLAYTWLDPRIHYAT